MEGGLVRRELHKMYIIAYIRCLLHGRSDGSGAALTCAREGTPVERATYNFVMDNVTREDECC